MVLCVYLVSYVALSFLGGYRLVMSGQARPTGLAFSDTFVWQPRFGTCYPFHTAAGDRTHHMDGLGLLYFPLIRLDQIYVHQSRLYITFADDDVDKPRFHPWPPAERMHPNARRQIRIADAALARHQTELDAARARNDLREVSRIKKLAHQEAQREIEGKP